MNKGNYCKVVGMLVAFMIIAMVVFIFSIPPENKENNALINLEGTWEIAVQVSANSPTLLQNNFITFNETIAESYQNKENEPYAVSNYTLTGGSAHDNCTLVLTDVGRSYTVTVYTNNYIRLYSSQSDYMELIRCINNDMSAVVYDKSLILGIWDVTYRNTSQIITNERIEFLDAELRDFRNGMETPTAVSPYFWNKENCLVAEIWGMEMKCIPLSEDIIFLIETDTGYIWELTRVN